LWSSSIPIFDCDNATISQTYFKFFFEKFICQGVSAAFSAPLLANIPVTHRGVSNQVVMCTGYGREGSSPDLIQYHEEQTIVFLMAVGRLRVLCERLINMAGYPKDTPVGIIERAGCPNQRTVIGNMQTIADIAERHNIQAPSTIVVGKVVDVLLEKDESGMVTQGLLQNATTIAL
jgi:uroporphyrin-III C-methyltransferase